MIIDSVREYPESGTSEKVQSGHDPEPRGESRVGKVRRDKENRYSSQKAPKRVDQRVR